jgi:divalent metal cation (Fe/Co/Zn/Cd) transporter
MSLSDRAVLLRRARRLEVFTVVWNSAEGLIAVLLGVLAGSIALVGFGIDSFIETSSGLALLWRLQTRRDAASAERADATALRLVGASLLALAVYVVFDSARALHYHETPDPSPAGIALAIVSLVVMPILAREKRRIAAAINSRALEADSLQTSICTYLSAILLGGLLLNALFGWWWADPVAALAMTPFIAREGFEALRGERCEGCAHCGTPACICG